ncbi:MAG TPA: DinB family protein [Thermomicrobiales bacterium]|jgi:hypothetical protein
MDANERATRDQVLALLRGGMAHMTFDEAVADFPAERMNDRPPHVAYSPWHLLEHLRLAQRDILDFIRDPDYQERRWPDDYWPAQDATADAQGWDATLAAFRDDFAAICAIADDPQADLHARIPWGDGQTILRELLLVADHNAYHIGEFAILRQMMGTWPASHE